MNFKIHRGTNEIGGSCVEVWTSSTRILLDLGMPLVDEKGISFEYTDHKDKSNVDLIQEGILPDIPALFTHSEDKIQGILISHYHQDHHGLLHRTMPNVPVYAGKATREIIDFGAKLFEGKALKHPAISFDHCNTFKIGDLIITPYLVDHSAFDAYAFLIEHNGKRLFYSGDFRAHGRKSKLFQWMLQHGPRDIDYLLMEGTTLGRDPSEKKSESDLEKELTHHLNELSGIKLIMVSAQNIDRLVSIYRSCIRANKLFVIDIYTALVLKLLQGHAKTPHPSEDYPLLRVFYPYSISRLIAENLGEKLLYTGVKQKITREEIIDRQKDIVLLTRPSIRSDQKLMTSLQPGSIIYSLWSGYLENEPAKSFVGSLKKKGFQFRYWHTSGHAYPEDLKEFVKRIQAKNLVPIHTFKGDEYQSFFEGQNIVRLKDKEEVPI